jgi:deoxyribodipyrimidine photo-lyase
VAQPTVLWWIRRDLRLGDNPALAQAAAAGRVVAVFVLDPRLWDPAGPNRRAFLAGCLADLNGAIGGHLVIRRGRPAQELPRLAKEVGAGAVYAAADFGPYGQQRDEGVETALGDAGVAVRWAGTPYAVEPGAVTKADGSPFRVFTPFSRAWASHGWDRPVEPPAGVAWQRDVPGDAIPDVPDSSADLPAPGEEAARQRWDRFKQEGLDDYAKRRNVPSGDHTSRLSAYLKWGCIHPRTLLADLDPRQHGHSVYRNELCWREFYADVLFHRPESARQSLQPAMRAIKVDGGKRADQRFDAWAAGRTGYPIVDAGMRQLRAEGWMHNRLRMVVASFLVKDLHIAWQRGAQHFLHYLVDGDLASNNHGWQWVAGTGTDAAPYYRVFNPVLQGTKFDPDGEYIRTWVPELASVAKADIHEPWLAANLPLDAGDYPAPIVDHKVERDEALQRYEAAKRS